MLIAGDIDGTKTRLALVSLDAGRVTLWPRRNSRAPPATSRNYPSEDRKEDLPR